MKNISKYAKHFFMPPDSCYDWASKTYIEKPPVWCSVDLRDGNQALISPMSLEDKLDFFKKLCKIGFTDIEIGFPAASETEFTFCRKLIEEDLIPEGVTVQVLTQAREHIIAKTFEALKGCKNAIVHLYNSTSPTQREIVFRNTKEQTVQLAVDGAKLLKKYADETEGNFRFEYSPENFSETEPQFALEVCNAVLDVWQPTKERKAVINLPVTVEISMPHVYACQVEYMSKNLKYRDSVLLSLHTHNDRGCAVADTEAGLLAGADRVEGTLFGNGERTGNADLVTVALNMYSQGVDPALDLSDIPDLVNCYEKNTGMTVFERHPYSGDLVFAAFSGSHQNAIARGMEKRDNGESAQWNVPYLLIDPKDIGREYRKDVIRINSQSGKGGIGYLLHQKYGYDLPKKMREDFGYAVKAESERQRRELSMHDIHVLFRDMYVNVSSVFTVCETHFRQNPGGSITAIVTVMKDKNTQQKDVYTADGNGRLNAVANALEKALGRTINVDSYQEHALERGATSQAVAYVGLQSGDKLVWGAGKHTDIITASINALVSAVNREIEKEQENS